MGRLDFASGPRSVSGTIDRLAVLEDQVALLDYKTSPYVPNTIDEISPDYVTQMALYRALVSKIYPSKTIRALLVWTHGKRGIQIMELPQTLLDAALTKISGL